MYKGRLESINRGVLHGWAWNTEAPNEPLTLYVRIGERQAGEAIANRFRRDLEAAGIGNGQHCFEFVVPQEYRDGGQHRVSLSVSDISDATPFLSSVLTFDKGDHAIDGRVEILRNRHVHGWAWDRYQPGRRMQILVEVDGAIVGKVEANLFRADLQTSGVGDGHHAFRFGIDSATRALTPGEKLIFKAVVADGPGTHFLNEFVLPNDYDKLTDVITPALAVVDNPVPAASAPPSLPLPPVKASPGSSVSQHIRTAIEAERTKDIDKAIEALDSVLALDPNHHEALFRRARIATALGDFDKAFQLAFRGIKAKPGDDWLNAILARVADKRGQRLLALEYWSHVSRKHTTFLEGQQACARILVGSERIEEARTCLETIISISPALVPPRRSLIELLRDAGETEAGIAQCEALLAIAPSDSRALQVLEHFKRGGGSPAAALIHRYRNAMSGPVSISLATGSGLLDCVMSVRIAKALAAHFDCAVQMIVPELSAAASYVYGLVPEVAGVSTGAAATTSNGIAFVLPEYEFTTDSAVLPPAKLLYSYTRARKPKNSDCVSTYESYADWLRELCGDLAMPRNDVCAPGSRSGPIMLVTDSLPWPAALSLEGRKHTTWRLATSALAEAAAEAAASRLVVCLDDGAAAFALSCGANVCHLSQGGRDIAEWMGVRAASVPFTEVTDLGALVGRLLGPDTPVPDRARPSRRGPAAANKGTLADSLPGSISFR